jgi:hypothetical protein
MQSVDGCKSDKMLTNDDEIYGIWECHEMNTMNAGRGERISSGI